MSNLRYAIISSLVAVTAVVGGCSLIKREPTLGADAKVVKTVTVRPTLESLDRRVTAIEQRLDAAKAARARRAAQPAQH